MKRFLPFVSIAFLGAMLVAGAQIPAPTTTAPTTTVSAPPVLLPTYPRVNVKAFGATGNGITDDSAAIQAAVNAAYAARNGWGLLPGSQSVFSYMPPIFFPAGNYLVSTPNCFIPTNIPANCSLQGSSFIGETRGGVQITFNSNGTGWLFNDQDIASQVTFQSLQFVGQTGKELGLRFCGLNGGRTYGAHFIDCAFWNFAQAVRFDGSQMTSENDFLRCSFTTAIAQTAVTLNNQQSVNNRFDDCDAYGTGTTISVIQGGFLTVRNLNCVLNGGVFLQTGAPNSGIGPNNDGIFVEDARCELYGAQFAVIANGMHCTIRDSNFNPVAALPGPIGAATAHLVATNGSTIRVMNTISSGNLVASADALSSITYDKYCNPIAGATAQ
jgi:hypothetical protein